MRIFTLHPPEFPSAWANAWGQDSYGYWQTISLNNVQQVMRWIPSGQFQMGSPASEPDRFNDETLHQVTLTQGYWLADTACTQALWLAVMHDNPSGFNDHLENPVNKVSWQDCQRFFVAANALLPEGFELRFPTEAEWEYACRANTTTVFSWGDALTTEQANYDGNSPYNNGSKGEYREAVVKVLTFPANPWGLYQMHGNVWEWCSDWKSEYPEGAVVDPQGASKVPTPLFHMLLDAFPQDASKGQFRVLRGGCGLRGGRDLRSARRHAYGPNGRYRGIGFRLAGG